MTLSFVATVLLTELITAPTRRRWKIQNIIPTQLSHPRLDFLDARKEEKRVVKESELSYCKFFKAWVILIHCQGKNH